MMSRGTKTRKPQAAARPRPMKRLKTMSISPLSPPFASGDGSEPPLEMVTHRGAEVFPGTGARPWIYDRADDLRNRDRRATPRPPSRADRGDGRPPSGPRPPWSRRRSTRRRRSRSSPGFTSELEALDFRVRRLPGGRPAASSGPRRGSAGRTSRHSSCSAIATPCGLTAPSSACPSR